MRLSRSRLLGVLSVTLLLAALATHPGVALSSPRLAGLPDVAPAPASVEALARDAGASPADARALAGAFAAAVAAPTQEARLRANDAATYQSFGTAVALSGDRAIISRKPVTGQSASIGEAAYIFVRSGSTWAQEARLTASYGTQEDFGTAVALSGDRAAVGAPRYGVGDGAVYVYVRSGTTWTQEARIESDAPTEVARFGASVALSGDRLLVGEPNAVSGGQTNAGAAYVFTRSGSEWAQDARLQASDPAQQARFGTSVALSDDRALVGAIGALTGGQNTGAAYTYTRSGTAWLQEARLQASDAAPGAFFGSSVALTSDRALVGSVRATSGGLSQAGAAYVFARLSTAWEQEARLQASDLVQNGNFGTSVALSGDRALIGAAQATSGGQQQAGAAYVFARSGSAWTLDARLQASDPAVAARFGTSVALSDDRALIGAPFPSSVVPGEGAAYVFSFAPPEPQPHYVYVSTPRSYAEAEADAVRRGGHLASIATPGENEIVRRRANGASASLWIGFNDRATEGTFVWTDGTPATYTNWNPGEPNDSGGAEDCAELTTSGRWNDNACTNALPYVVEIPAGTPTRYELVTTARSFNDAQADAVARRGWLASVADAADQAAVRAAANGTDVWIGFTDGDGYSTEGTFVWTDGTPSHYTNWNGGEPNDAGAGEDCTVLTGGGGWNDASCSGARAYVDEIPTDLPPPTLVVDTAADDQTYVAGTGTGSSLEQCSDGVSDGDCTLREAIAVANANDEYNLIAFNITSGLDANGVATITVSRELPRLTSAELTVDGYTQPGASPATATAPAAIRIQLFRALSLPSGNIGFDGLTLAAPNVTIRGLSIGRFGVYAGISVRQVGGVVPTGGVVEGNFIGVSADGTTAAGNGDGVLSAIPGLRVGTDGDGVSDISERNVISGNVSRGVAVSGDLSVVAGNYIGTNATATGGLPNRIGIVSIGAGTIGSNGDGVNDDVESNVVAFNSDTGVLLVTSSSASVLGNRIYGNGQLGIDVGSDGVTPNDPGDGDTGANGLQNYPVVTATSPTEVAFTLNSRPNRTYRVEFFASTAADPTGYGEGERYLGFVNVVADGSGNTSGTFTPAAALTPGEFVTSTATPVLVDGSGNVTGFPDSDRTSEFSLAVAVASGAVTQAAPLYNPSPAQGDGAGYRLLGAPVDGLTVTDLAALNLVQGVPAGADPVAHPAQYANAGHNVFPTYTGFGSGTANFPRPAADAPLAPGRGFYWYLYDTDVASENVPASFGPGTSDGYELTGFALSAAGPTLSGDLSLAFSRVAENDDDFFMLANPFARPLAVSGITATGGAVSGGVYQAYDLTPSGPTFVTLGLAGDDVEDVLAVWQGVFAELVPSTPDGSVTVTYSYAATQPGTTPPFYGRGEGTASRAPVPPTVRFALAGQLADGTPVADRAAVVRFEDGAAEGWDARDASKLTPPSSAYALVAPVAERGGEPHRLAVDTRPLDRAASVPLVLSTTGAGAFRLSWTLASSAGDSVAAALPAGWSATLTDTRTGRTVDLAAASGLDVSTDGPTAEANRFLLTVTPNGVVSAQGGPLVLGLSAPSPNPAAGRASLTLTVPSAEAVRVTLVDALGREVRVLHDGEAAGAVPLSVPTAGLSSGVYTVRAVGADFLLTRRLTVVR